MPGPQPEAIELSDQARQDLEKLAARHTTGQQKAQRARIILKAAEGKNNAEIGREVKQSIDMVRLWRRRWLDLAGIGLDDLSVEERLDDLPRPGAPSGTDGLPSARQSRPPDQPMDRPGNRGRDDKAGYRGDYLTAPCRPLA